MSLTSLKKIFLNCRRLHLLPQITSWRCVQRLLPATRRQNCTLAIFHFAQACKRRASQIDGFVNLVRSNKEVESIYYRLLCSPLLPVQHIFDAFKQLKSEARAIKKSSLRKFVTYFKRQWIKKVNYYQFEMELNFIFFAKIKQISFCFIHHLGRTTQNLCKWCKDADDVLC